MTRRLHIYSAKFRELFTGPTYKFLLSFTAISGVYRSFVPNKTTFTKHCLKAAPGNFHRLAGVVNAIVYKTEPIFTGLNHGKLSQFLTMQIGLLITMSGSIIFWQNLPELGIKMQIILIIRSPDSALTEFELQLFK